jgi:hypothetical protein
MFVDKRIKASLSMRDIHRLFEAAVSPTGGEALQYIDELRATGLST